MPFPGHPIYLEQARAALDLTTREVDVAKQQVAISQIASLVSQAMERREGPHPDTLRRIDELTHGLCLAAEAAILMRALAVKPSEDQAAEAFANSPLGRNRKGGLRGSAAPQ